MANDNHLFSVPCYDGTMLKQSDGGFRFFWLVSQLFSAENPETSKKSALDCRRELFHCPDLCK